MEPWKTWGRSGCGFALLRPSCEHSSETLWQVSVSHPQQQALSGCHVLGSGGWDLCRRLLLTYAGLCHVVVEFVFQFAFQKIYRMGARITIGTVKPSFRLPVACAALAQLLCAQCCYNSETSDLIPSVFGFSTCTIIIIILKIVVALQLCKGKLQSKNNNTAVSLAMVRCLRDITSRIL